MIEDMVIGIFLGGFLVAGPQLFFWSMKMRKRMTIALSRLGITVQELDRKEKKKA